MIDYYTNEIEAGEAYYDCGIWKIKESNLERFLREAPIDDIAAVLHREPSEAELDSMTPEEFAAELDADREVYEPDYSWEREDYEYEKRRDRRLVG